MDLMISKFSISPKNIYLLHISLSGFQLINGPCKYNYNYFFMGSLFSYVRDKVYGAAAPWVPSNINSIRYKE